MIRVNKRLPVMVIMLLWPSWVVLQAGPGVSSAGQRPALMEQSKKTGQKRSSDQTKLDEAKTKSTNMRNKIRAAKRAALQVRQTLKANERRQFDAMSQLARKAISNPQSRQRFHAQWKNFTQQQARAKRKMNINTLMQAVMYETLQQEERALASALVKAQNTHRQKKQLRVELSRARQHQRSMNTQQGKISVFRPARIKGLKSSRPVRTKAEMNALMTDMENNMSAMSENSQQMMMDLQNQMQQQARMMQTMSNIMKAMHDTAQSVIRNMR